MICYEDKITTAMIRKFIEEHRLLCVIVSVAVIFHIGVFFTLKSIASNNPQALHSTFPFPGGGYDPVDYLTLAENMLAHGNFSMLPGPNGDAETYRTPGYPLFVALVQLLTGGIGVISLFQIILMAISAFIVYFLIIEISPTYKNIALFVAALFVFDPSVLYGTQFLTTESLYTLPLLLSMYFIVKKTASSFLSYGLAGIFLGLSALVRPSGFYMVVPFGIWLIICLCKTNDRKHLLVQSGIFFLGLLIITLPWTIRNGVRTGVYEFSSLSTYNTMFNIPVYLSYRDKRAIEDIRADLDKMMGGLTDTEKRDSRNGALMRKIEWNILKPSFLHYTFFHVSKSANFFFSPGLKLDANALKGFWEGQPIETWHPETSFMNSLIERRWNDVFRVIKQNMLYVPESIFLLLMFIFGLYWSLFSRFPAAKLIFGCVLFMGLLTSPITNPRYRAPITPFVYLSGIAGISLALDKYKNRSISKEISHKRHHLIRE